jgi:hypothetical protein
MSLTSLFEKFIDLIPPEQAYTRSKAETLKMLAEIQHKQDIIDAYLRGNNRQDDIHDAVDKAEAYYDAKHAKGK